MSVRFGVSITGLGKALMAVAVLAVHMVSTETANALDDPVPNIGDFAVYNNAGAAIVSIAAEGGSNALITNAFPNTVVAPHGAYAIASNRQAIVMSDGKHLVLYNTRLDDLSGGNRAEAHANLSIDGGDTPYGWGQGFIRDSSGDDEMVISGGAVVDVTTNSLLRLKTRRTDANSTKLLQVIPSHTAIQLLKLDDGLDCLRVTRSSDTNAAASTTFTDVAYNQIDETSAGAISFTSDSGDITLNNAGHYLVLANTGLQKPNVDGRTGYTGQLTLDGVAVEGSKTTTYMRGNVEAMEVNDGVLSIGMIVQATTGQVLNVEHMKEGGDNATILATRTALAVIALPSGADFIRLEDTSGQNLNDGTWPVAFATQAAPPDAVFSHSTTTDPSEVTVNATESFLFLGAFFSDAIAAQRLSPWQQWRVNGAVLAYGEAARYSRNDVIFDCGNWSGMMASLEAGDRVEMITQQLGASGTAAGDSVGLQGIRIASLTTSPVLILNKTLGAYDGIAMTITSNTLKTVDSDTADSGIVYMLTSAVTGGTLTRNSITLGLGDTFTQADVGVNHVAFTPSGTGTSTVFRFSVNDGGSNPSLGAFSVRVVQATSLASDTGTTDEDTVLVTVASGTSVLNNDTGDGLTVTSFDALSANGARVNVSADGTFAYNPVWSTALRALANGGNLVDTFDYTVTDAIGESNSATVSVTVTGTNDHFGAVDNAVADTSVTDQSSAQAVAVDLTLNDGIVQTANGTTNDNLLLNYDAAASNARGRWENLGFGTSSDGPHDLDFIFNRGVTLNRSVTSSRAGITAAYEFDGSISAYGRYDGSLDGSGTGGSIHELIVGNVDQSDASFEFWVKLGADDLTQHTTIFEAGGGTGFGIIVASNGILTAASETDGAAGTGSTVRYDLLSDPLGVVSPGGPTGDFNQYGVTIDLNAGLALYVNGVLVDETTSGVGSDWDGGDDSGLGHFRGSNHGGFGNGAAGTTYDTHFHGAIAVMRVYTGILSPPEFMQNYSAINSGGVDAEGNSLTISGIYNAASNLVPGTGAPVTLASGGIVTLDSATGDFTINVTGISDIGTLQLGETETDAFDVQMVDGTGEARDALVSVLIHGKNQARAVTLEADELVTTHFHASEIVGRSDHGVGASDPFMRLDANAYTGSGTWANEGWGGATYDATMTSGAAVPAMSKFAGIGFALPDPRGTLASLDEIGTGDATFEMWFKPDVGSTENQLLFEVGGDGIAGASLVYDDNAGLLRFTVDNNATVVALEAAGISRSEYNQVVAVYDRDSSGDDDILTLYINNSPTNFTGTPVATSPAGTTALNQFSNIDGSGIGIANNTYADTATVVPFEGKLAAVRVYSRVLTTTEIETNFDALAHPITTLDDVPTGTPGPIVTTSTLGATVTLNADGSVDYDATSLGSDIPKDTVVQDYFTFVISDGEGGNTSATLTLDVTGVDTGGAEFLAVDDHVSVGQNAAATAFDPRANDLGAGSSTIQPLQTHETSYDEAWAAGGGASVGDPAVFTNGWRLLWNAPSAWNGTNTVGNATNGFVGSEADYIPLKWSGTAWAGDGDDDQGNGDVSKWLSLHAAGGHPGEGSGEADTVSNNVDRCPIAAYTVPTNGTYAIANSTISVAHGGGHVELLVYVNDTEMVSFAVPGATTRAFDIELGALAGGDDIYVAVSPHSSNANDTFTWDFDIIVLPSSDSIPVDTLGTFTSDGTNVTYDPNGQFTMLAVAESVFETITYTIVDGADSSTAEFTVEVVGVNDAPTNADDSYATDEDSTVAASDLLDDDADPDSGEALTVRVGEVQGAAGNVGVSTLTDNGGSVTVQANGGFVYDPGSAFQSLAWGGSGSDTFTYLAEDIHGLGATNAATVTINISGNEDGVDARDDFFSTAAGGLVSGNLLSDNGAGADSSVDATDSQAITAINTNGMIGSLSSGPKVMRTIGTCGSASVSEAVQTVTHGLTLTNPVVIAGPPSYNEAEHCVVRVFNVTPTTFDLQLHEQPEGGAESDGDGNVHTNENVHWLVLAAGQYELPNGLLMEVGKVDTTAILQTSGDTWETVSFATSFSTKPAVLNTIQTLNGDATENAERMGTRMQNVSFTGFQVAMEDHEGDSAARTNAETIAWVAIEPGNGTWGGGPFEAGTTALLYDDGFSALNFVRTYGEACRFVASQSTWNGMDPGQLRRKGVGSTSVDMSVIEDTYADAEVYHALESVAYIVIDSDGGNLTACNQAGNQGDFTYDPGSTATWRDQTGTDTFTYTLTDGRGNTDTGTVTIAVSVCTILTVR
ncbi:MAG: hypothetical protein HN341_16020 [Verrucomicrobia bacterium]|nr:hypothetical protein [Verrucomicrobiota bacterium]